MDKWFEKAFTFTIWSETSGRKDGGYTNDTDDPGGETKYGISKNSFPNEDIKNLTLERAKELAYKNYWVLSDCDKLVNNKYPLLAIATFDASFHCGVTTAKKFIQKYLRIADDGIIGQNTLKEISKKTDLKMTIGVIFEREDYFDAIISKNGKLDKYDNGWENRLIDLIVDEVYTLFK